jgi:hypothetical protein
MDRGSMKPPRCEDNGTENAVRSKESVGGKRSSELI